MAEYKIIPKLINVNNEPITSAAGMQLLDQSEVQQSNIESEFYLHARMQCFS